MFFAFLQLYCMCVMQTVYDHRRLRCCLVNISVIISITSTSDVIVRLNNPLTLRCSTYCTLPAPSSHLAFLKNSVLLASFYRRAVRTRVCSRFYHCREVNPSEFTLFSPGLSVQLVKWVLGADKAQYCDSHVTQKGVCKLSTSRLREVSPESIRLD